jgi:dolichol-phosphate mannosyltransferase
LSLSLTDAFCGFKCYRASALSKLNISEPGYAMPLEVWVQAAAAGLKIIELPVPLIYLDEKRSFGGVLDDGQTRLEYYHLTLDRAIAAVEGTGFCIGAGCGD